MKNTFAKGLLKWHLSNARELPWKNTNDPYKIWVSEIVLQQTQVKQGTPYYSRFIKLFPSIKKLAGATEDEVMSAWQGLGYYSRARNMHSAAKQIENDFDGKFPDSYDEIIKLKGIGTYTAAAISSFAFNLPHAVVDGNVYRVLARAFGLKTAIDTTEGKKVFSKLANELLDKKNPAAFNQAIMDFGAIVCSPQNPICSKCFYRKNCVALNEGHVSLLPFKSKKIIVKKRWFTFFVMGNEKKVIIEKRNAGDIWNGLYQFPLLETKTFCDAESAIKLFSKYFFKGKKLKVTGVSSVIEHKLTHQTIISQFIRINLETNQSELMREWKLVKQNELNSYPFPKLIDNYIKNLLH